MRRAVLPLTMVLLLVSPAWGEPLPLDESPTRAGEWGHRPADGSVSARTPPAFAWRPQKGAVRYCLQASRTADFDEPAYEAEDLTLNVHTPPVEFESGTWIWRFCYEDEHGEFSPWSRVRQFEIARDAVAFPLPPRGELLSRVPKRHPRLFVRPEQIPELRRRARTDLEERFAVLDQRCAKLLKDPPPTEEPPKYTKGMKRGGEAWRKVWWGNRTYTIRLLDAAATLGFTWRVGGDEAYGQEGRRLLLAASNWNPRGATGYGYNDEAGMPYAYHFSRAYTYLHALLTDKERRKCRAVMRIRGNEMYRHLCPRHLWRPYSSHSNRAWHFLGEVAIAFHREIPEADDWLWFAVNVFTNAYPVWSDADGGWHEGLNYWRSYVGRFTWWGKVMKEALDLDAYQLPYFSRVGYYAMYVMPPGTVGGGFGDLCARVRSEQTRDLMTVLAGQARNPHWQWYVDRHGGPPKPRNYVDFLRATDETVEPESPAALPTSRLFAGTGQAVLNTSLLDAKDNVEIIFKSSPFGSQSHGYEAQNSFLLYAYGERLLIRSGRRDSYGSNHHRHWMWQTKSVNSITVNGRGQIAHSPAAVGRISRFHTSPGIDFVEGEADRAYMKGVKRFSRAILFAKPDLIVIRDRLETTEPSTFDWHLHTPVPMKHADADGFRLSNRGACCRVRFLAPTGLEIQTTDLFDPPPRPRVKLTEYHLTAQTTEPSRQVTFVTVIRPWKTGEAEPAEVEAEGIDGGLLLRGERVQVLVRTIARGELTSGALRTAEDLAAWVYDDQGRVRESFGAID